MKPLTSFDKALVPLVVMGALTALGALGVTGEMTVEQAVTLVATSALVWFKRNK